MFRRKIDAIMKFFSTEGGDFIGVACPARDPRVAKMHFGQTNTRKDRMLRRSKLLFESDDAFAPNVIERVG
jgi:hypothetical protein